MHRFTSFCSFLSPYARSMAYKRRWFNRIMGLILVLFYAGYFILDKHMESRITRAVTACVMLIFVILTFIPRLVLFTELFFFLSAVAIVFDVIIHTILIPSDRAVWITNLSRDISLLLVLPPCTQMQPKLTLFFCPCFLFEYLIHVAMPELMPTFNYPALMSHTLILLAFSVIVMTSSVELDRLSRAQFKSDIQVESRVASLHHKQEANIMLVSHIFPESIQHFVLEASAGTGERAQYYPQAIVLFGDLVQFGPFAEKTDSLQAVSALNKIYALWDSLCNRYHLLKIKTIGEVYMAVYGIPEQGAPGESGHEQVVRFALDAIRGFLAMRTSLFPVDSGILPRFGVHCGPVVAGTIGSTKVTFDVWGDTVNLASRTCTTGRPLCLQASQPFLDQLPSAQSTHWEVFTRGKITIKNHEAISVGLVTQFQSRRDTDTDADPTKDLACAKPEDNENENEEMELLSLGSYRHSLTQQPHTAASLYQETSIHPSMCLPNLAELTRPHTHAHADSSHLPLAGPALSDMLLSPPDRTGTARMTMTSGSTFDRIGSQATGPTSSATSEALGDDLVGLIQSACAATTQLTSGTGAGAGGTPRGISSARSDQSSDPTSPRTGGGGGGGRSAALPLRERPSLRRLYRFRDPQHLRLYARATVERSVHLVLVNSAMLSLFQLCQLGMDFYCFPTCTLPLALIHGLACLYYTFFTVFLPLVKRTSLFQRYERAIRVISFLHYLVLSGTVYLGLLVAFTISPPGDTLSRTWYEGYFFLSHLLGCLSYATILFPIHSILFKLGSLGIAIITYNVLAISLHRDCISPLRYIYLQVANAVACVIAPIFTQRAWRLDYLNHITVEDMQQELTQMNHTSKTLLHSLLPPRMLKKLRANPKAIAQRIPDCSVLYADLVCFTSWCQHRSPQQVVGTLDKLFQRFDYLARLSGVDPCTTIGDCYVATCNVMKSQPQHVGRMVRFAQRLLGELASFNKEQGVALQLRVGVACGSVISAVLGTQRFMYDVFGPAASMAKTMEATGCPGAVHVTEVVHRVLPQLTVLPGPFVADAKTYLVGPSTTDEQS